MIRWRDGVDISEITADQVVEILRAVPDYVNETIRNSFFHTANNIEKYGLDSFTASPREFICSKYRIHIYVASDNEDFLVSVEDWYPVYVPVLSICPNFKGQLLSKQRKSGMGKLTKDDIVRILNRAYTHSDGRKDYFFVNVAHDIQNDKEFNYSTTHDTLICDKYNLRITLIDSGHTFWVESENHSMEVPTEDFTETTNVISKVVSTVPEGCVRLPQDKNGKYINPDDRPILKWTAEDSEVGSYMFLTNITYCGTDPDGEPIWTGEGDDDDDFSDNLEGSEIVGTYRTNGVTKDVMGLLIEAVQEHDTEKTLLYAKIIADQHTEI